MVSIFTFTGATGRHRKLLWAFLCATCFVSVMLGLKAFMNASANVKASLVQHPFRTSPNHRTSEGFRPFQVDGYDTVDLSVKDILNDTSCQSFARSSLVGVQDSIFLEDDLFEIARTLDAHPMVDYPRYGIMGGVDSLSGLVTSSWDRLATSCAFMSTYRVHLCISRVIFHPRRAKDHPRISFLRGQIFDDQWTHIKDYKLKWRDQVINFPRMFDVEIEYKLGHLFFGPEDPRIIIEDIPEAEPIIVFNMMSSQSEWKRAMWMFRPFTQKTTLLTIDGTERTKTEKNWAPFFIETSPNGTVPNMHLHFVQNFAPLKVLDCDVATGLCRVAFEQETPHNLRRDYMDQDASLRGGTQFVSIPRSISGPTKSSSADANIHAFLSFPRHHVKHICGCNKPAYRPEIATLVTNTTHFYLNYLSAPLDFGPDTVLSANDYQDGCGAGRILIANSIAHWDLHSNVSVAGRATRDVMTLALSVNDATSQIVRVAGVYDLLSQLPSFDGYFESAEISAKPALQTSAARLPDTGPTVANGFQKWHDFQRASVAAWKARTCLEDAALEYTKQFAANTPGIKQWLNAHANNLGFCLP